MTEYYVIDSRTNKIVNCITTDKRLFEYPYKDNIDAKYMTLSTNPSMTQLQGYEFWNERP